MLQDPPHLLKKPTDKLEQARQAMAHALQRQAVDFLPTQWALAIQSANNHPATAVAQYLQQCQIKHTVFNTVTTQERHHLPDNTICVSAQGDVLVLKQLAEDPKHWPLQQAFMLVQQLQDTDAAPEKSLSEFWNALRNSAWLKSSISKSLSDFKPVVYASLLINLLALAPAFFSIQVYDRIIPNSAYASLVALLVGVLMCLGFEHVLKHARHRLMEHAATVADTECARQLSLALLNVRTNQTEPAVLLQHLRSFEQLREIITGVFLLALIDLPFLSIFLLVIGIIHPLFLLIAAATIALTLMSVVLSHRAMAAQSKRQMLAFRTSQNQWLDALANLELIQTAGVQNPYSNELNTAQLNSRIESNHTRDQLFDAGQRIHLLQQISWILSITLGVYLVVNQQLSIGGMIAVSMLTMRCFGPIQKLQNHLMQTHSAQSSFEDLDRFLAKPLKPNARNAAIDAIQHIELEGAHALKPGRPGNSKLGSDHLLQNVHLQLEMGSRLGVIGPMGSGKTSLLKLLAGQVDLHTGSYRINRLEHHHHAATEHCRQMGVALQPPLLVKGTLLENIQFKRPWVNVQDCLHALQKLGMDDWVHKHADGLHMRIESQGSNLSAGQKQAVSLARALAGKPTLLLLDEPTVCLDQLAESRLIQTLQSLPQEVTLVLTTHKLNLLSTCKSLCLIDEGTVMAQGDKASVLQAANTLMKQREAQNTGDPA